MASCNPWRLIADVAGLTACGDSASPDGYIHTCQITQKKKNNFFTDDIRFSPGDNIATTDTGVQPLHPEDTTAGKGMKAGFYRDRYQLLADVRDYYHAL